MLPATDQSAQPSHPAFPAHPASPALPALKRLPSIDFLRGGVMVIMALDHTRDFIHNGAMLFSPEDLARTTPLLFLTRWITHVCAPTFMVLAGFGAFLRADRDGSVAAVSRFLWTRGLWLIVLELTVMRLAMNFSFDMANPVLLLVLTALGASMIALAGLIHLPSSTLLAVSLAVIALHNSLDGVRASEFGAFAWIWNLLHQPGAFSVAGVLVIVGYPLIPWIAVMAAAFACGPVLLLEPEQRRRRLLLAGIAMTLGFVLLRAANVYGDPSPWSQQASPTLTVLSFLRTTKYPPSLAFLLMTVGPAMIALSWLDRREPRSHGMLAVVGRVPMFFYVVHFWMLHIVAAFMAWLRYGGASFAFLFRPLPSMGGPRELFPSGFGYSLWVTYFVWAAVVASLYPLCRWFDEFKRTRRRWWASYI